MSRFILLDDTETEMKENTISSDDDSTILYDTLTSGDDIQHPNMFVPCPQYIAGLVIGQGGVHIAEIINDLHLSSHAQIYYVAPPKASFHVILDAKLNNKIINNCFKIIKERILGRIEYFLSRGKNSIKYAVENALDHTYRGALKQQERAILSNRRNEKYASKLRGVRKIRFRKKKYCKTAADGQENEKPSRGKDVRVNKSTQTNEYVDAETSISDSDFDNDATDEYPTLLATLT
jgi:hypothetical protein